MTQEASQSTQQRVASAMARTRDKIVLSRLGRIFAIVNSDLWALLLIGLSVGICAGIFGISVAVKASDEPLIVPVITGILAGVGALMAYCFVQAGRRVATVDIFIGDIQTQISGIFLVVERAMVITGTTADSNAARAPAGLADHLRRQILALHCDLFDAQAGRLEDLMRMPTRYITAFYAEVRFWKVYLKGDAASGQRESRAPTEDDVLLAAYLIIKRGLRAVSHLMDRDEIKGYERFEDGVTPALDRMSLYAALTADQRARLKTALSFTEYQTPNIAGQ